MTHAVSTSPATDPKPAGEIRADTLYLAVEFRRRLGWGLKSYRQAKRRGLRFVRFARREYVAGADVLAFFGRLAEDQELSKRGETE